MNLKIVLFLCTVFYIAVNAWWPAVITGAGLFMLLVFRTGYSMAVRRNGWDMMSTGRKRFVRGRF